MSFPRKSHKFHQEFLLKKEVQVPLKRFCLGVCPTGERVGLGKFLIYFHFTFNLGTNLGNLYSHTPLSET